MPSVAIVLGLNRICRNHVSQTNGTFMYLGCLVCRQEDLSQMRPLSPMRNAPPQANAAFSPFAALAQQRAGPPSGFREQAQVCVQPYQHLACAGHSAPCLLMGVCNGSQAVTATSKPVHRDGAEDLTVSVSQQSHLPGKQMLEAGLRQGKLNPEQSPVVLYCSSVLPVTSCSRQHLHACC